MDWWDDPSTEFKSTNLHHSISLLFAPILFIKLSGYLAPLAKENRKRDHVRWDCRSSQKHVDSTRGFIKLPQEEEEEVQTLSNVKIEAFLIEDHDTQGLSSKGTCLKYRKIPRRTNRRRDALIWDFNPRTSTRQRLNEQRGRVGREGSQRKINGFQMSLGTGGI